MESCHTGPSWFQDLLPKNAMCANVCTWKLEDMTTHGRVCTCHGCLFQCSHTWTLVRQIMFDTQEMANIHNFYNLPSFLLPWLAKADLDLTLRFQSMTFKGKSMKWCKGSAVVTWTSSCTAGHAVSWKTSPDPEWFGTDELVDICSTLFSLHTNGVLQSTKMRKTLLSLLAESGSHQLHQTPWYRFCRWDGWENSNCLPAVSRVEERPKKIPQMNKKTSVKENVLSFLQLHEDDTVQIGKNMKKPRAGKTWRNWNRTKAGRTQKGWG